LNFNLACFGSRREGGGLIDFRIPTKLPSASLHSGALKGTVKGGVKGSPAQALG